MIGAIKETWTKVFYKKTPLREATRALEEALRDRLSYAQARELSEHMEKMLEKRIQRLRNEIRNLTEEEKTA